MNLKPLAPPADRLPPEQLHELRIQLHRSGIELPEGAIVDNQLAQLRGMYEPFVYALAQRLEFTLPQIVPARCQPTTGSEAPPCPTPPASAASAAPSIKRILDSSRALPKQTFPRVRR